MFTRSTIMLMRAIPLLLCTAATQSQANIVVNGSFETPVIDPSISFLNLVPGGEPTGFAWNVATNNVDIVTSNAFGTASLAFDGMQYLDLVGFGSTGGITQSFATVSGGKYTLSFAFANNAFNGFPSASAAVTIASGGSTLLSHSITHSTSTASDLAWTVFSATFTADGPSATLTFAETFGGTNAGLLLDAIAVNEATTVSEPSSLAMLGLSMVVAGFARRRGLLHFQQGETL